jgi:DNA modification methylase
MTDNIQDWANEVHQGDVREKLQEMPEESVDMVITSPPYYGLRDYGDEVESVWGGDDNCEHKWCVEANLSSQGGNNTEENPPDVRGNEHTQETRLRGEGGVNSNYCSKCGAWKGQLGLEPSPIQFVQNITEICNEIYRVLKPSGSFYLNLGDTYAGGGGISGVPDDWDSASTEDREKYPDSVPARDVQFPDKCKMLIPHRVAISLIDEEWILRNDNVWFKGGSAMPESVTDRRTTSFEFLFHFVKEQEYYYDELKAKNENGANELDVFEVNTASHSDAHFAVFPSELIESPINSSCPAKLCSKCRKPYKPKVEKESNPEGILGEKEPNSRTKSGGHKPEEIEGTRLKEGHNPTQYSNVISAEYIKDCECDASEAPGVVLDPFIGSGTTAVVAEQLDRDWIGIDLNKDYVDMSYDRIENETKKIFDDRSVFDY